MKITIISILEKSRAPSRNVFRKGLVWIGGEIADEVAATPATPSLSTPDTCRRASSAARCSFPEGCRPVRRSFCSRSTSANRRTNCRCRSSSFSRSPCVSLREPSGQHPCPLWSSMQSPRFAPPQGTRFSTALLRQRLSVSCDSDNTANIAYMGLEVKPKQKITVFGVFRFLTSWIKKFSSPKMRNRQFVFAPKIEYKLVAERSEANLQNLQFPQWCPQQESNLHLPLRTGLFYPLNYEGLLCYYSLLWTRKQKN